MLEDIKNNITRLIALYEGEKQKAEELSARLSHTEEALKSCREQITDLNQQIDNLKLASAFTGGSDNSAAKERIDKLIREIEKCIKLLEK